MERRRPSGRLLLSLNSLCFDALPCAWYYGRFAVGYALSVASQLSTTQRRTGMRAQIVRSAICFLLVAVGFVLIATRGKENKVKAQSVNGVQAVSSSLSCTSSSEGGNVCSGDVTWPTSFSSSNYVLVCVTPGGVSPSISSQTASGFTVASAVGGVNCIGVLQ
jgi:hypothetical protein